jgi:hypothetical protein
VFVRLCSFSGKTRKDGFLLPGVEVFSQLPVCKRLILLIKLWLIVFWETGKKAVSLTGQKRLFDLSHDGKKAGGRFLK